MVKLHRYENIRLATQTRYRREREWLKGSAVFYHIAGTRFSFDTAWPSGLRDYASSSRVHALFLDHAYISLALITDQAH